MITIVAVTAGGGQGGWSAAFAATLPRKERVMARNTGQDYRRGSVDNRTQSKNPVNGNWTKRDAGTGRFTDQKEGGQPFKGIAKEVDHRRK